MYKRQVTGIIYFVFPAIPGTKGDAFICSSINRATAFYPCGYFATGLGRLYKDRRNPEHVLTVNKSCLLYTSDAADDLLCVDLGGRRIIKKKKKKKKNNK